ncbi:MAG: hypothetical protein AB1656_11965 [Candidatus Omnitrophota bacterium]
MNSLPFKEIQNLFLKCLKEANIFDRPDSDGRLFEAEDITKDNKRWLAVAAGVNKKEASELFFGNKSRAVKAEYPIRFHRSGEIRMLFIVRPFDSDLSKVQPLSLIMPFAKTIPWLEVRQAYLRVSNLPQNDKNIDNIRWEWDCNYFREKPQEFWLKGWFDELGFNPSHSPSHLHFNSNKSIQNNPSSIRDGDLADDLRLAIGNPNPLAFIISLALWIKTLQVR